MNTKQIAVVLREEIEKLTGKAPYLIINNLHRSKMDPNHEKEQAAFGNPLAGKAWEDYQKYISDAKKAIGGPGVLFDIHGKRRERIELGYLVSGPTLDNPKAPIKSSKTSIKSLADRHPLISFDKILRGKKSFGAFIEKQNQSLRLDTAPFRLLPTEVPEVRNSALVVTLSNTMVHTMMDRLMQYRSSRQDHYV